MNGASLIQQCIAAAETTGDKKYSDYAKDRLEFIANGFLRIPLDFIQKTRRIQIH